MSQLSNKTFIYEKNIVPTESTFQAFRNTQGYQLNYKDLNQTYSKGFAVGKPYNNFQEKNEYYWNLPRFEKTKPKTQEHNKIKEIDIPVFVD